MIRDLAIIAAKCNSCGFYAFIVLAVPNIYAGAPFANMFILNSSVDM